MVLPSKTIILVLLSMMTSHIYATGDCFRSHNDMFASDNSGKPYSTTLEVPQVQALVDTISGLHESFFLFEETLSDVNASKQSKIEVLDRVRVYVSIFSTYLQLLNETPEMHRLASQYSPWVTRNLKAFSSEEVDALAKIFDQHSTSQEIFNDSTMFEAVEVQVSRISNAAGLESARQTEITEIEFKNPIIEKLAFATSVIGVSQGFDFMNNYKKQAGKYMAANVISGDFIQDFQRANEIMKNEHNKRMLELFVQKFGTFMIHLNHFHALHEISIKEHKALVQSLSKLDPENYFIFAIQNPFSKKLLLDIDVIVKDENIRNFANLSHPNPLEAAKHFIDMNEYTIDSLIHLSKLAAHFPSIAAFQDYSDKTVNAQSVTAIMSPLQVRALVSGMKHIHFSLESLVGDIAVEDEETTIRALKEIKLLSGLMYDFIKALDSNDPLRMLASVYAPWVTRNVEFTTESLASLVSIFASNLVEEIAASNVLLPAVVQDTQNVSDAAYLESMVVMAEFQQIALNIPEAKRLIQGVSVIGVANTFADMLTNDTNFVNAVASPEKVAHILAQLSFLQKSSQANDGADAKYDEILKELAPYQYAVPANFFTDKISQSLDTILKDTNVQKFLNVFMASEIIDYTAGKAAYNAIDKKIIGELNKLLTQYSQNIKAIESSAPFKTTYDMSGFDQKTPEEVFKAGIQLAVEYAIKKDGVTRLYFTGNGQLVRTLDPKPSPFLAHEYQKIYLMIDNKPTDIGKVLPEKYHLRTLRSPQEIFEIIKPMIDAQVK